MAAGRTVATGKKRVVKSGAKRPARNPTSESTVHHAITKAPEGSLSITSAPAVAATIRSPRHNTRDRVLICRRVTQQYFDRSAYRHHPDDTRPRSDNLDFRDVRLKPL